MSELVRLAVNGEPVETMVGSTVAVAVALAGRTCRKSVTGERRFALCGMGICFECVVTIDGVPHLRSCMVVCQPGMNVTTDD